MDVGRSVWAIGPDESVRLSAPSSEPRAGLRLHAPFAVLLVLLTAALVILAWAMPVNHDEDQYLAATVLAAHGQPFRDFLYLQTPLQPLATAPLALLFPGHVFQVLRLFSAVTAGLILWTVFAAQRRIGVSARDAAAAVVLMASCYAFQFSASVFRNDAMPTLLLGAGLLCALTAQVALSRRAWLWALAGLCLGASASTKISFLVPLGAAGAFICVEWFRGRAPRSAMLGFSLGAVIGLAPTVLAWRAAPEAFVYGVFGYFGHGPTDWYQANGLGFLLRPWTKPMLALANLAAGPALATLVLTTLSALRRLRARTSVSPSIRLLEVMVVAGLLAALLPNPNYKQYFMPVLPPLFVLFGLEVGRLRTVAASDRTRALAALGLGLAVGAGHYLFVVGGAALSGRWSASVITDQAHWIGDRLRVAGASGAIATLSPDAILDSGFPLDRRFATGVFVYRTGDRLTRATLSRLHALSPSTLDAYLDHRPPAAILTGYESGQWSFKVRPDDGLRAYARAHGYRLEASPWGVGELYIPRITVRRPR